MRQRPDPMIGGLVYETLNLVCAEFQIASVGGSSHQSLCSQCNVFKKRGKLRAYNESLLQQIGNSDHQW